MTWKEELRLLKLAYLEKKSPDFLRLSGGNNYKMKPWEDKSTNGLTNAVYDWLKYHNHWVNRVNSTGVARKINGKLTYTSSSTNKGTADISAIIAGQPVVIEIKNINTKDRMSKHQTAEKERIERSGGIYIVVSDMTEFAKWYYIFTSNKTPSHEPERENTIA